MSEPVNGNSNPPVEESVDPSPVAAPEPMDTTTDEPRAGMQLQPSTQPEPSAQPPAQPTNATATATASPKPEPNASTADTQPIPGAQTVREVLNTKINPFISAGLRQIFRDPANIPEDPLRILGEFLLEKHRETAAKEAGSGQARADGADS